MEKLPLARRRRSMRGQSAVETIVMLPIFILVFMGMYELFTITYGAQKAHIRAREYVLHAGVYTPGAPAQEDNLDAYGPDGQGTVFDPSVRNYKIASTEIWGAAAGSGSVQGWRHSAHDRGIPGVYMPDETADQRRGTYIKATAYLCSPIRCPDAP